MKKIILLYPFFLLLPFLFVACEEDDDDDDYYDYFENLIFPDPYERYQDLYADDKDGVVHFEAKRSWSIELNYRDYNGYQVEDWLTVDKTSGQSGRITLRYTLEQNETKEDRTADLTIYCGDDEANIRITQSGWNRDGTVPQLDLTQYGFVKQVNVIYEGEYSVVNSSYSFEYDENDDYRLSYISYNSDINSIYVSIPHYWGDFNTYLEEYLQDNIDLSFVQETGIWSTIPFYRHKGELLKMGDYRTNIESRINDQEAGVIVGNPNYSGDKESVHFSISRGAAYDNIIMLFFDDYKQSRSYIDEYGYWQDDWLDVWYRYDIQILNDTQTSLKRSSHEVSDEEVAIARYESKIPNSSKVSIDLNALIYADPYFGKIDGCRDLFSILSLYGQRSTYLVSESGDELTGRSWNYDYKLNNNGFVEQVTVTNNYNSSKVVYTIEYLGQ